MKYIRYITIALFIAASWGCSDHSAPATDPGAGEVPYKLTIEVPEIIGSRAFGEENEDNLHWVDVLVFRDMGGGVEKYAYHRSGTSFDNSGSTKKTFVVSVKKSTDNEKYRFVILANMQSAVAQAADGFDESMTKQEVLDLVRFEVPSKWNTSTPAYLPMWGETTKTVAVTPTSTGTQLGVVKLLHSLARIDVGLRVNATRDKFLGLDNFEIEHVRIHNHNNIGAAAPSAAALPGFVSEGKVSVPSVPSAASLHQTEEMYTVASGQKGFMRDIYVGEYNNKALDAADADDLFCILIGGYYDGSTDLSWYRVDMYDPEGSGTPFENRRDILRNYRYLINITVVDGPGYSDIDDAIRALPMHMTAEVIGWDQYWNSQEIGGNVWLEIDNVDIEMPCDQMFDPAYNFTVTTNDPKGIKITITDENDVEMVRGEHGIYNGWFRILSPQDPEDWTGTNTTFRLGAFHNVSTEPSEGRYARIYVEAGPWKYVVNVKQRHMQCGDWINPYYLEVDGKQYMTNAIQNDWIDHNRIAIQCYMLENLAYIRDGDMDKPEYVIKKFPGRAEGERGYYYSSAKIIKHGIEFCPEGWHTPRYHEYERGFLRTIRPNETTPNYGSLTWDQKLTHDPALSGGYILRYDHASDDVDMTALGSHSFGWAGNNMYQDYKSMLAMMFRDNDLFRVVTGFYTNDQYVPSDNWYSYHGGFDNPGGVMSSVSEIDDVVQDYFPLRCIQDRDDLP